MAKLTKEEITNYRKYHIQGCGNLKTCKVDAIIFSKNEKINHSLSKSIGGIMLKKFGDIKFTDKITQLINELSDEIKVVMGEELNEVSHFITEACPNLDKKRRIDLVKLHDNTPFEWENNHKENKPGAITIYI